MKKNIELLAITIIIIILTVTGCTNSENSTVYDDLTGKIAVLEKENLDLKEEIDYELIAYSLEGQANHICEYLRTVNGMPYFKVRNEEEIKYIKIANEWFLENNSDSKIELIALGYVLESDESNKLVVEGLIYDASIYENEPQDIVITGQTPFKYVQFRLIEQDDVWTVDDYIDQF